MFGNWRYLGPPHLVQDVWVLFAGFGVAETLAKHGFNIQIGDDELVLERWPAGNHRAVGSAHDAGAVENELILPSHSIQVGYEHAVVSSAGGDHALALGGFAGVEW